MTQLFWVLTILIILISACFESPYYRAWTAVGLVLLAAGAFYFGERKIKAVNSDEDKPDEPDLITKMKLKKVRSKLDEVTHQYLSLKTLSNNQTSQNGILDAQLTRMQDSMRFILTSLQGITEGQANDFIDKVKKGKISNREVRAFIDKCLGVRAERRNKRSKTGNLKPGDRVIDLL